MSVPTPAQSAGRAPVREGAEAHRPVTTATLATLLGAELVGPADLVIARADTIDTTDRGAITFIRDERFARQWVGSGAAAAVVSRGIDVPGHDATERALLIVPNADLAVAQVTELLSPPARATPPGVHPSAVVDPSALVHPTASVGPLSIVGARAVIGEGACLHAQVYVGEDARIGARCVLWPRVCVLDRCEIGAWTILHPGVSIGGDGFGYRPSPDGRSLVKIPHVGTVRIGEHVEIGANACVDRARFGATVIGDGTKIDNLCQVAHNCRIGRNCVIAGCTGIAGSVTIGDWVQIGGGCGIADNVTIGDGARIGARGGVMSDVPAGATMVGLPVMPGREYLRMQAYLRKMALGRNG